ncbi:MAG TPA: preprotein translocase subunit YajC [Acidimicrobiales bacterium]|nr:preprotein translocase subunit YajC [Acidimicrobiales bacterium]
MQILFLVLIFVLMYALLVRPQQRRARQQRALIASLEVGAEVQTVGGIMGRIVDLDDELIRLEVAPGVVLSFVRGAIARVVEVGTEEEPGMPADPFETGSDDPTGPEGAPPSVTSPPVTSPPSTSPPVTPPSVTPPYGAGAPSTPPGTAPTPAGESTEAPEGTVDSPAADKPTEEGQA